MKVSVKIFIISFVVFFGSWFLAYSLGLNTLPIQSEDTVPALFIPFAVLEEKTLYLDTYYEMMRDRYPHPDDKSYEKDLTPFYLKRIQDGDTVHYLSAFPIITGLLAIPFYLIPILLGYSFNWETLAVLSHLTASVIISLSGAVLYILLKRFFLDHKKSLLLTSIYLFGTINFALISQSLWQHGTLQLFIICSTYFLLKSLKQVGRRYDVLFLGFFSTLAILTRPTAVIVLFFYAFFVLQKMYKRFGNLIDYVIVFFIGSLPNILFFLWYNQKYYLSIFNQGYASQVGDSWQSKFPEGFLGLWLSPSKGILVYSPILIFSLVGIYLIYREKKHANNSFYLLTFCAVIVHTLVLGKWKHWYGGWSYGYRMASDILPLLIFLLVPYVKSKWFKKYKSVFYAIFIVSILIQIHGIIFFDGIWHAAYDEGFKNTGWLWSLKDSEFIFNIRRVLVKLGYLEQACPKCLPG